ncbi:hypothetical protein HAZT_HAZT011549 [Hyalella azteca]|uniref:DUF7044 domain-containing protein n=1 Tax=Hyalella azteca TaxID=294128 RepID=A0A6A0HA85_HYAAZ|nr:hypothetical protein HAZT_HAZT011549 [Hyalella azteca]
MTNGVRGARPCLFPGEVQGVWATQAITSPHDPLSSGAAAPLGGVTYSMITIAHTAVHGWGDCLHRHKRHYVLAQGYVYPSVYP